MKWYTKSVTVLGVVITALSAILAFMQTITPEIAKTMEVVGASIVALGIRKKLEAPKE